jgi:isopentenyl phosphate kinase
LLLPQAGGGQVGFSNGGPPSPSPPSGGEEHQVPPHRWGRLSRGEMDELVFLKLGGSLITDKTKEATAKEEVIRQAAREVNEALAARPDLRLLVGHGSGSFGHFVARRYGLPSDSNEESPPNWRGYAETGAAAARLNRLLTDIFLAEGVPVVSIQPSASAHCWDGELVSIATEPIELIQRHGLVPLVYGDVALDKVRGCTIISTEQIFAYLADHLEPARIVLAGEVEGVFTADPFRDESAQLIPEISPHAFRQVELMLTGSHGVDVTGGMLTKVRIMHALVQKRPELKVQLISGRRQGMIRRALLEPSLDEGTTICYEWETVNNEAL